MGYVRSFENFLKTRDILNSVSYINGDTMEDYQQYLLSLNSKTVSYTHLTPEQEIAVKSLSEFLLSPRSEVVFMLRGYAGTGKTLSLIHI